MPGRAKYGFTVYRDLVRAGSPTEDFRSREARVRALRTGDPVGGGLFVLYWMQMYLRGSENAALNEAIRRANHLGLPLLVYQGLGCRYPEANARTHTFILECVRDVASDLAERGIPYRFHLCRERSGTCPPVAVELARSAACVIVDDYPTFILPGVTRALVEQTADTAVPILAVDANGLVPLADIPDRQYAAYTIRPRLHSRIPEYLVPETEPELNPGSLPDLPVDEDRFLDLSAMEDPGLAEQVATCEVDQTVLPSLRHRGGRRAGLARLVRFLKTDLEDYAQNGNDPGAEATSSLSPYLHYGCLSTVEVVRRTLQADANDEGVDAFLEQLVVRRELAYNFCRYTPVELHQTLDALPDWASKTMSEHEGDDRAYSYSLEELEAGRTHDEIWNAAQHELVATGTFHGYLRMLWGKNVIRWTGSYEQAQDFMVRMHHRYALDGRNPNTYASILWCFGLHDRAFREMPVLGKLRPLNSSNTRRKFDLDPYMAYVTNEVERRRMPVLE